MQVSHVHDHVTHAVISGHQTIDFGISNSAEFFHILSSTLYKDQILAVVREVLCNAWDAHIEAGCTERPVEITLTNDKFVIRDYGTGIHHDDMGTIYGTYGNSTKKNDGKQTGGFGLGCKAPFAYTDHFEVVSSHDGTRTIYNLSKSAGQVQGKPGIIPIASFPTTETGLQVTIPVKNSSDHRRFSELIHRIARNGDMHMTLNGTVLDRLQFDTTQNNYLLLTDRLLDVDTRIMIRYGNVVYPVDRVKELYSEYDRITSHLGKLSDRYNCYSILFQAPPHSISVTPSRETLSMQDHTLNTLRTLFNGFLQTIATGFAQECETFAKEVAYTAAKDQAVSRLLDRTPRLPSMSVQNLPVRITDLPAMARRYLIHNYPATNTFRKKDLTYRLQALVQEQLVDRGLVQTFLKALQGITDDSNVYCDEGQEWLQQRVIGRLLSKMLGSGLHTNALFVYDPDDTKNRWGTNTIPLILAKEARPVNLFSALPYLRNIIVVTTSTARLTERINRHDTFKKFGAYPGFLVYRSSMKKAEKEAALAFFNQLGMTVVDLTFKQEWEIDDTPKAPVVRKPVKEGVPLLRAMKNDHNLISTSRLMRDDIPRTTTPEFIVQVSLSKGIDTNRFEPWTQLASRNIIELFGDKGAITNNSAITAKWIKQGAKSLEAYLSEKLVPYIDNSAAIQHALAFDVERLKNEHPYDYDTRRVLGLIYGKAVLRTQFGLPAALTGDDRKYLQIWREYVTVCRHNLPDEARKLKNKLADIPLDPINLTLLKKIKEAPLRGVLDMSAIESILLNCKPDSAEVKTIIDILGKIFN